MTFKANALHTAQSELFQYDGLNRLTNFSRGTLAAGNASISGTSSVSQSWNLDVLGNWHSSAINNSGGSTTTTTRTNNGQNQATVVGGNTLTYDADGNTTMDQNGQGYAYDGWNRVAEIGNDATSDVVTFGYDALGRRITESDSASSTSTDLYYSSRGQVLDEYSVDASGTATDGRTTTFHYIWTLFYVDQLVARDQSVAESDFSTESAGPRSSTESDAVEMSLAVRLYAQQDADYNVTSLTNASGVVVERYLYDPYGNVTVLNVDGSVRGDGTAAASNYGWVILDQGKRVNVQTGTVNFNARVYILGLDRFAQQDPAGYVNGANRDQFEESNGNNNLDPSGLGTLGATVGAFVGLVVGVEVGGAIGAGAGGGTGAALGTAGGPVGTVAGGAAGVAVGGTLGAGIGGAVGIYGGAYAGSWIEDNLLTSSALPPSTPAAPATPAVPVTVPPVVTPASKDDSKGTTKEGAKPAPAPTPTAPLPANPNDLLNQGYIETTSPEAGATGHRTFENPTTGDKLRFDLGVPGAYGNAGKDHYHRENPDSTGKRDANLDKNGKPVPRGSRDSHLYPPLPM